MIGCECCEVGNEEEIEEQFDRVSFMSLRKDKVLLIGAFQRGLDDGCGLMQPFEMLLSITTRSQYEC